jgi:hypothetical protein
VFDGGFGPSVGSVITSESCKKRGADGNQLSATADVKGAGLENEEGGFSVDTGNS